MVLVWRYETFGQYQSKGQCIAFRNRVQKIAEALPRTLTEVFVNVKDMYGHGDITIRIKQLRKAITFFKLNHPPYEKRTIKEENFETIKREINEKEKVCSSKDKIDDSGTVSASQMLQDVGQNQIVEEHIAQVAVTSPLTVEASASKEEVSKTIKNSFQVYVKEV